MTKANFVSKSKNAKTGQVAGTVISSDSCPRTCGLQQTCYAKFGHLSIHWRQVSNGRIGDDYRTTLDKLRTVPASQLIRHKFAGDDPHIDGDIIEADYLYKVECNNGHEHIDYTHHQANRHNITVWNKGKAKGFIQNLSADNMLEADYLYKTGFPVTVILPINAPNISYTPGNNKVIACPSETTGIQCIDCKRCAKNRSYIIGFRAHGTRKKALSATTRRSNILSNCT